MQTNQNHTTISKKRVLDLFCGTKSIANVFQSARWETITVDNDPQFSPDIVIDVLKLDPSVLGTFDVIWASPPCTAFSVASIGRHWKKGLPSDEAILGGALLGKTLELINILRPTLWFIENPRGMMRTLPIMASLPFHTVTYCQYGDTRMKPTDIWTNASLWVPRPACKNGDSCHVAAPRGARTGTQGLKGAKERARVPDDFCKEILGVCERTLNGGRYDGNDL